MKGKGMTQRSQQPHGSVEAEGLAVQALGFLAADAERLGRFLAVTGLGPENLRAAAAAPGFLAGVLAYLAEDEALLLAFASDGGVAPERIAAARLRLAGSRPTDTDF
jgi:Protein of unknown function (DUF3572)